MVNLDKLEKIYEKHCVDRATLLANLRSEVKIMSLMRYFFF